jgi:hypothetical protein
MRAKPHQAADVNANDVSASTPNDRSLTAFELPAGPH